MSLSSTTTCQESSRSFKDYHVEKKIWSWPPAKSLQGPPVVDEASVSLVQVPVFLNRIMNHFQITKPNKSITNPRTKLKPNPKWFAPQSYEPTPADVSRSRFAARRSFAEVPDQTHQQGRGPCKVIMMMMMMLFWRLSSDIAALSRWYPLHVDCPNAQGRGYHLLTALGRDHEWSIMTSVTMSSSINVKMISSRSFSSLALCQYHVKLNVTNLVMKKIC